MGLFSEKKGSYFVFKGKLPRKPAVYLIIGICHERTKEEIDFKIPGFRETTPNKFKGETSKYRSSESESFNFLLMLLS